MCVCVCFVCVCTLICVRVYYWRAGASQPSRTTGAIFLYIYIYMYLYGRALHIPYISKCFYVNFFKRNHRVQRSTSYLRAACTYRNVLCISKSANLCTEPREICVSSHRWLVRLKRESDTELMRRNSRTWRLSVQPKLPRSKGKFRRSPP